MMTFAFASVQDSYSMQYTHIREPMKTTSFAFSSVSHLHIYWNNSVLVFSEGLVQNCLPLLLFGLVRRVWSCHHWHQVQGLQKSATGTRSSNQIFKLYCFAFGCFRKSILIILLQLFRIFAALQNTLFSPYSIVAYNPSNCLIWSCSYSLRTTLRTVFFWIFHFSFEQPYHFCWDNM